MCAAEIRPQSVCRAKTGRDRSSAASVEQRYLLQRLDSLTRRQAAELVAASPACWRMNQMPDPADLDFAEFVSNWIAKDLVDVDRHTSAV